MLKHSLRFLKPFIVLIILFGTSQLSRHFRPAIQYQRFYSFSIIGTAHENPTHNALQRSHYLIAQAFTDVPSTVVTLTPSESLSPTPTIVPVNSQNFQMITACFGDKSSDPACTNKSLADLNGDGLVDGLDYNLYLISVNSTITPIPVSLTPLVIDTQIPDTLTPSPFVPNSNTPTIAPSPLPTTAPVSSVTKKNGNPLVGVVLLLLFISICIVAAFILIRRKKLHEKPIQLPTTATQKPTTPPLAPVPDQPIAKSFFVKPVKLNSNTQKVELTLVDDTTQLTGVYHYQGQEVKEGFANVKGILRTENGKQYIIISELSYID